MAPSEAAAMPQAGFTVHLAQTGRSVAVPPGQSILHALLAAGVDAAYSCEEGICGACEVALLAGAVRHHDTIRSAAENDRRGVAMICCAESLTDSLTLDI